MALSIRGYFTEHLTVLIVPFLLPIIIADTGRRGGRLHSSLFDKLLPVERTCAFEFQPGRNTFLRTCQTRDWGLQGKPHQVEYMIASLNTQHSAHSGEGGMETDG